jgi:hypothetical protein
MSKEWVADDKKSVKRPKPEIQEPVKQGPTGPKTDVAQVTRLQQLVGNRAVQRLLAQRSADGSFELDDDTASRINQARGGGQPLDSAVQQQMSTAMGHDFSGVRVHTSSEADELNQQLSAKAFTTGQDVFFRQGDYDPGSSGGRELIAHELTHVVQQGSGLVGGGGGMTVRPAGDVYEQDADAIAKQAASMSSEAGVQTAGGETAQRQDVPEDELAQTKALQRQEVPEEEEPPAQLKALQRQDEEIPEEEL